MKDVVKVSSGRTAIGAFGGSLRDSNAAVIASVAMKEAVSRAGIDPTLIDDVRFGSCLEHEDIFNVARIGALLAGIPDTVPAVTINRVCISGMEAVISGMAMIQAGMADVILAGGVDHMSGVSYTVPNARWGCRLQDQTFADAIMRKLHCGSRIIPHPETGPIDPEQPPLKYFVGKPFIMGHTAEFLAQHYDISREEMDEVALRSHHNAEEATKEGRFKAEIVPVPTPNKKDKSRTFEQDEHFRSGITLAQLNELPPVFIPKTGKVTAGNSSGVNDGAAALLIMSADKAKELELDPIAVIKATGRAANHPVTMGISPVSAVKELSKKSGLTVQDFDLVEINEAFAVQYLACEREMGLNREITNVNGSGIGLGHPVGATGARIMVTLIHALQRENKSLGLATLCGGGGIAMACALEIIN